MNNIKNYRKKYNLSQQDLANLLMVNQTAVSQWERGTVNPSYEMLIKLSNILNVRIDDLLNVENERQNNCRVEGYYKLNSSNEKFEVIMCYNDGIIQVLKKDTFERVIIPYRIKIEGNGSFISNLKMLRKAKMITQEKLAIECGVSYSTIVSYEKGLRKPTGRILCILANYFGIDAESLLGTDINNNKED